ncbi:addiction module antidote protein [Sulfurovum sp. ST-21]|uniref:Putative addiction module antidote protein n=1 Tax=Sulfurovum indicum TaxID=2779528 RepID=A0A7M1S247_9BACT|nr:addiction module antidote protein [Sulfurovum indicum]QOR61294.1 putative addiction module antidote protein [Sulfurovum indicum]
MNKELIPFDLVEYLDNEEAMAEYLSQVLEDGDNDEFLRAIGYLAKAKGMAQIAKETGMGRESLYKAFRPNAKPRFDTVMKVLHALKLQLTAAPQLHQ